MFDSVKKKLDIMTQRHKDTNLTHHEQVDEAHGEDTSPESTDSAHYCLF